MGTGMQPVVSGKANAFVIIRGRLVSIPFLLAVTSLVSVSECLFFFFHFPFFFASKVRGQGHGDALLKVTAGFTKSGSEME